MEISIEKLLRENEELKQAKKDAEYLAWVWQTIRNYSYESILAHGDLEGIDFVANRVLSKRQNWVAHD
jgi:hypothetical protein